MRRIFLFVAVMWPLFSGAQSTGLSENVILVTFDGFRWQEFFGGAQKKILQHKQYAPEPDALRQRFGGTDDSTRRARLLPFIWNVLSVKGQIYGNKKAGNRVTLTNGYKFSYPGYNEIFSGWGDHRINSNDYPDNPNYNIFDFLAAKKEFEGKLFAVATWDAFPRIINEKRNHVPVYTNLSADSKGGLHVKNADKTIDFDQWQTQVPVHNLFAQTDTMTYMFAKEYMARYHPRFSFIGFDETDHFAHKGNYEAYLSTAKTLDCYMQDLWDFVQSDPMYKDKTTIIITCDHGRGDIPALEWRHHGHVYGAEFIWIATMGPGIKPKGEVKIRGLLHQNQIAATIAALFGYAYKPDHFSGKVIDSILTK